MRKSRVKMSFSPIPGDGLGISRDDSREYVHSMG